MTDYEHCPYCGSTKCIARQPGVTCPYVLGARRTRPKPDLPNPSRKEGRCLTNVEKAKASGEVRVTSPTGAQKGSKPQRFDLIPAKPMWLLAEVYGKGCEKYADRNWEGGYRWSLSFAACLRHLWRYWRGEYIDPETGLPHLAHAAWHCFTLMEFHDTKPEFDDRVKGDPL